MFPPRKICGVCEVMAPLTSLIQSPHVVPISHCIAVYTIHLHGHELLLCNLKRKNNNSSKIKHRWPSCTTNLEYYNQVMQGFYFFSLDPINIAPSCEGHGAQGTPQKSIGSYHGIWRQLSPSHIVPQCLALCQVLEMEMDSVNWLPDSNGLWVGSGILGWG